MLSTLLVVMVTPALANRIEITDIDIEANAEVYAYLDFDAAPLQMKEVILEARNIIIFDNSWVADGYEAWIEYPDGTQEELPTFSELFPNWDFPEAFPTTLSLFELMHLSQNIESNPASDFQDTITNSSGTPEYFHRTITIPRRPSNALFGAPFATFSSRHNNIRAGAVGSTVNYNVGLSFGSQPAMFGTNFRGGMFISLSGTSGRTVSAFVSTDGAAGTGLMRVEGFDFFYQ